MGAQQASERGCEGLLLAFSNRLGRLDVLGQRFPVEGKLEMIGGAKNVNWDPHRSTGGFFGDKGIEVFGSGGLFAAHEIAHLHLERKIHDVVKAVLTRHFEKQCIVFEGHFWNENDFVGDAKLILDRAEADIFQILDFSKARQFQQGIKLGDSAFVDLKIHRGQEGVGLCIQVGVKGHRYAELRIQDSR